MFMQVIAGKSRAEIEAIKRQIEAVVVNSEPEGDDRDIAEIREEDELRRFKQAYADILRARALQEDPRASDTAGNDGQLLECDAVHRLIGLPATCDWMLWQKIECLDVYMREIEDSFYDQRTTRLYGSIKSDILNFRLEKN